MITDLQIREIVKCRNSFEYFCENINVPYFNIFHGVVNPVSVEQSCAYLLWVSIFQHDKTSLVASPDLSTGSRYREVLKSLLKRFKSDVIKADDCVKAEYRAGLDFITNSRIYFVEDSPNCGKGLTVENMVMVGNISDEFRIGFIPTMGWNPNAVIFQV